MMNPLNTQETESMQALQKSFERNARKASDITIFDVCELRAGALGKLLAAAQAPTPQPAYPAPMPCPPAQPAPACYANWDGKVPLRPTHFVQQGCVAYVHKNEVCVISSLDNNLTVYQRKDIKPPLDNFDKMAEKILDTRGTFPANLTSYQRMAAILRKLHDEENLFQVIGVARA